MNLQEIKQPRPHDLWNIIEMFGGRVPLQWKTYAERGQTVMGTTFEIDGETYNLTGDFYSIVLPSQQTNSQDVIEISFRRILETGEPTVSQTDSKHPAKVFGIVYNGVQEIIKTEHPDIIFFSAKYINDGGDTEIFQKRLRIYQELYNRVLMQGYTALPQPLKNSNGVHFVLFDKQANITQQDIEWIGNNI